LWNAARQHSGEIGAVVESIAKKLNYEIFGQRASCAQRRPCRLIKGQRCGWHRTNSVWFIDAMMRDTDLETLISIKLQTEQIDT
jgi:hypothetical protein